VCVCVYIVFSLSFLSLANSLVSRRLSGYLILSFFFVEEAWGHFFVFVFVLFFASLLLLVLLYLSLPLSHLHGASRLIWITDEPTSAQYTHRFKLQVAYNTLDMNYFIIMKKKERNERWAIITAQTAFFFIWNISFVANTWLYPRLKINNEIVTTNNNTTQLSKLRWMQCNIRTKLRH
jgi:hypothetical protein